VSAPEGAGPIPEEASVDPAGRPTALVVDDEQLVRALVAAALARLGCTVIQAGDGAGALCASARLARPIDLLVTDVFMPGMTGWELADRLRGEQPGLRVLVMSGADTEPSRAPGPGTAFLRKPFPPGILAERARGLLDGG
jgi:CheY-like chemotaxis protein